jgi:hypothetical protein
MKKAILSGICVLFFANAKAQGVGVEAGVNFSRLNANLGGTNVISSLRPGFAAGLTADEAISDNLSFRYGIFYKAKGGNIAFSNTHNMQGIIMKRDVSGYMRIDYAELPLSILYNYPNTYKGHFFVGGGVYLACAIGGIVGFTSHETAQVGNLQAQISALYPASVGSDPNDDFKAFDAGLQAQFGYEHRTGIYAKAGLSYGLLNIAPDGNNMIKNQSLSISLGYMIR